MTHQIKGLANDVLVENGEVSLTRLMTVAYFVAFVAITVYLVINGQTWGGYDTFAAISGGGGAASLVGNKFINSKYNSVQGGFDSKRPEQK